MSEWAVLMLTVKAYIDKWLPEHYTTTATKYPPYYTHTHTHSRSWSWLCVLYSLVCRVVVCTLTARGLNISIGKKIYQYNINTDIAIYWYIYTHTHNKTYPCVFLGMKFIRLCSLAHRPWCLNHSCYCCTQADLGRAELTITYNEFSEEERGISPREHDGRHRAWNFCSVLLLANYTFIYRVFRDW